VNTEIPDQNTVEVAKNRRLIPVIALLGTSALLALGVNSKSAEAQQHAESAPAEMIFGAMEDSILSDDLDKSKDIANKIAAAGFNTAKTIVPWTYPAQCAEVKNDTLRFQNAVQATKDAGLNLAINIVSYDKKGRIGYAPERSSEIRCYIDTAISYMTNFAHINKGGNLVVELTNEPNSKTFWKPQKDAKDYWIAPANVARLYSKAYSKLHAEASKLDVNLMIVGPGLASNHDALEFISKMPAIEQKADSSKQIFDAFSIHPYGTNPKEHPAKEHSEKAVVSFADYSGLKKSVGRAFGSDMQVWYSEYGVIASVPTEKYGLYDEIASSVDSVSETTQAEYYKSAIEMSFCQKAGAFVLFNFIDDPRGHWTSGIFYPDGSPKSSYAIVKQTLENAKSGNIVC
jgi:hypothetical protein